MCSRFRGSCPSDVKSAGHPESDFPIPLSGDAAALCAPREIQKNPAARSIPGYRPRFQVLSSGHRKPRGRMLSQCYSPRFRGFCPSDVKSAVHPEPGFPVPLSECQRKSSAIPGRHQTARPPKAPPETGTHPGPKQRPSPTPRKNFTPAALIYPAPVFGHCSTLQSFRKLPQWSGSPRTLPRSSGSDGQTVLRWVCGRSGD